jgi:hypothetical protein
LFQPPASRIRINCFKRKSPAILRHSMWGAVGSLKYKRTFYSKWPRAQCQGVCWWTYEGVSISFRTGRLELELQMVQLSATRCSCIAILWVSLVSFAVITLCVASQRVFIVYFVIDSVRKLLVTPSHILQS